ncbi:MAG TPA: hypothetical protein VGL55_01325 [Steroidobacteraceae bacterium]|jgi:hypothetical protein
MLSPMEVQSLLNKLCIDAGFYLRPQAQEKLRTDPPTDPTAITNAVFLAEGLNPELAERGLHRGVHEAVVNFWRLRGLEAGDTVQNNRRST